MNRNKVLNHKDPPNGLKEQIINALIVAGVNFFGTLAGLGATQVVHDPVLALVASGISAGFAFFSSLAVQRGLMKEIEKGGIRK